MECKNDAVIYKSENPMNRYCSKSMKSQNELPNVQNEFKTQNPQWVLSNVHKNVKNEPKMWKTARGTSMEAWRAKMEFGER